MSRLAIPCASLLLVVAAACNADNPNFGDDGGVDAPNTTCSGSGPDPECPPDNPICSDERCGGMCTTDSQCSGRGDGATVCLMPTGDCVACDESNAQAAPGSAEDECRDPTMPVCDATTHTCRACREHAECASGVCDGGACAPSANVIYMKADGADTGECLTPAEGCLTLHYAKGKLTAQRKFILMAPSQTPYDTRDNTDLVEFNGANQSAHVIGYDASLERIGSPTPSGHVIEVKSGAIVRLEGLTVANASGAGIGTGVVCSSGSILELYRARVENNTHEGIKSDGCTLRVIRSVISNNRGGGISASGGSFNLVNNFIVINGTQATSTYGGLNLSSTATNNKLEFNTVAENIASAGSPDGISCVGSTVAVRNNLVTGVPGRPRTNAALSSCVFTYNAFAPDNAPTGTGNVTVPDMTMFRFRSATDFHVSDGTAATGKAQATGLAADTLIDHDGNPRQEGSTTVEVGADEIP